MSVSLAELLKTAPKSASSARSSVDVWLDSISDEDRAALFAWVNAGLTWSELWRQCRRAGLPDVGCSHFTEYTRRYIARTGGAA